MGDAEWHSVWLSVAYHVRWKSIPWCAWIKGFWVRVQGWLLLTLYLPALLSQLTCSGYNAKLRFHDCEGRVHLWPLWRRLATVASKQHHKRYLIRDEEISCRQQQNHNNEKNRWESGISCEADPSIIWKSQPPMFVCEREHGPMSAQWRQQVTGCMLVTYRNTPLPSCFVSSLQKKVGRASWVDPIDFHRALLRSLILWEGFLVHLFLPKTPDRHGILPSSKNEEALLDIHAIICLL